MVNIGNTKLFSKSLCVVFSAGMSWSEILSGHFTSIDKDQVKTKMTGRKREKEKEKERKREKERERERKRARKREKKR